MTEDRNMIFIQTWLNYAAHYSRADQLDILLVCSWIEATAFFLHADPKSEGMLTYAARKIFLFEEGSIVYNFLKRMEELKASPAGVAGAIREMLLKGGEG